MVKCYECGSNKGYDRISVFEEVKVLDTPIKNTHVYDRCVDCGELYSPLDDIDFNLMADFTIYRNLKNYLFPEELSSYMVKNSLTNLEVALSAGIELQMVERFLGGSVQTLDTDIKLKAFIQKKNPN